MSRVIAFYGIKKGFMDRPFEIGLTEILATQEAEVGGFQVQSLPGLQNESKASPNNLVRNCLKIKSKGDWRFSSVVMFLSTMHTALGLQIPRAAKNKGRRGGG